MRKSRLKRKPRDFEAAYRLIQIAEKGGLLGDEDIKGLIMCAFVSNSERFYRHTENYITLLALENILWRQQNSGYSDGYGQRKTYQL